MEQDGQIIEMSESNGFKALRSLAEDEIKKLTEKLVNPKVEPSSQTIGDAIALRYEIKGLKWFIDKVDSVKKKSAKDV